MPYEHAAGQTFSSQPQIHGNQDDTYVQKAGGKSGNHHRGRNGKRGGQGGQRNNNGHQAAASSKQSGNYQVRKQYEAKWIARELSL